MPVTSWTFTAGLAKSLPSKSSITCVQEGREVKVSTVRRAACALHEAKRTRCTQVARLKNRVRGFAGGGPHLTAGPHARQQPRSLLTATSQACPRRPLRGPPSFSHRKKGCCYGTPPSHPQARLAVPALCMHVRECRVCFFCFFSSPALETTGPRDPTPDRTLWEMSAPDSVKSGPSQRHRLAPPPSKGGLMHCGLRGMAAP